MNNLIEIFEHTAPEIVFEWIDRDSEAKGWVVINSLRGGAAGGGTRMRKGLNRHEVTSLAKTMEIKFTVSGPQIGGAKSGIDFDPKDPRKKEVLTRWYTAIKPILKSYYGTGGDLNIDEIHEVIPITENLGIVHPQEGIVNGYFDHNEEQNKFKITRLKTGVSKCVTNPLYVPLTGTNYLVSDLITGYGVSEAVKHYFQIWGGNIQGKKAIIQGWGNVGAAAGYFLSKLGVKIVAIIDQMGGLLDEEGFSVDDIELFYQNKGRLHLLPNFIANHQGIDAAWQFKTDIFVPAAGSRMVEKNQMESLIKKGLKLVSCGANVPFNDPEIFMGPLLSKIDQKISIIPDFIANCGMARVFAYLMNSDEEITDKLLFEDCSNTIKKALTEVHEKSPDGFNLTKNSLNIAIEKLSVEKRTTAIIKI